MVISLESRLVAVSTENSFVLGQLNRNWLRTSAQIQGARMDETAKLLVFERSGEPKKANARWLRTKELVAGNGVAYEARDGYVGLYSLSPPNNPMLDNLGTLSGRLSEPYLMLSPEQSDTLRLRSSRSSGSGVTRFSFSQYPTAIVSDTYERHFGFLEFSKKNLVFGDDLLGQIHGPAVEQINAYMDGKDVTRIGLLRQREVLYYLQGAERGQMVASLVHLKGQKNGFDIYLGGHGFGYAIAQVPIKEWHKWLTRVAPK